MLSSLSSLCINFDKALTQSLEYAKALIIKADFYAIKNQHSKAKDTYLKSIQFNRNFDNVTSYTNYLFKQNNFEEMIKQLNFLKLESNHLTKNQSATLAGNLADAYQKNKQFKESEKAYDEALLIRRALSKENSSAYQPYVAITLNNLGLLYHSDNRLKKSEKAYDEALLIRRALSKDNPSAYQPDVAMTLNNLAILYSSDNRLKESEKAYDEALLIYRALSKQNPNAYGIDLGNSLVMGVALLNQPIDNLKEARKVLTKFRGIFKADKLLSIIDDLESK